jgi:hypothetical protein
LHWEVRTKAGVPVDPFSVLNKQPVVSKYWVRVDKAQAAVRVSPTSASALAGSKYLYKGNTFQAVGTVRGESVNGNNVWYVSAMGHYVWSGGLTKI